MFPIDRCSWSSNTHRQLEDQMHRWIIPPIKNLENKNEKKKKLYGYFERQTGDDAHEKT